MICAKTSFIQKYLNSRLQLIHTYNTNKLELFMLPVIIFPLNNYTYLTLDKAILNLAK